MLTVGQLARIFNISTKTLRYYDAIGLFIPASVGEDNLYRYYIPEQLSELKRILFLRSLGVGIEIVRELKHGGALQDDERIRRILEDQADTMRIDIARQQQLLQSVEQMIDTIHHSGRLERDIQIIEKPAFSVIGMDWHSARSRGTISELWDRFITRENEIGNKVNPEISYGICIPVIDYEFSYVAGFEANAEEMPEGMIRTEVPEQTYAVFTHRGRLHAIGHTMSRIYESWLPQNNLQPAPGIDIELYDERFLGTDNDDTEIDLYVPIIPNLPIK